MVAQQSRKLPHRKGTGVRISYPPPKFTSGCSWESSLIPNQAYGVRILIPVPHRAHSAGRVQSRRVQPRPAALCAIFRRARQMVSQHIAKVPSARARLGSIPRLSANSFSLGVRRIRLAAPACRAERSFGASRFESGGTHQTRKAHRLMRLRKRLRRRIRPGWLRPHFPCYG